MYEYRAHVASVYDGDTITVNVDLGFHIQHKIKVRLANIDAPEIRGAEREEGIQSRDALRRLIEGAPVRVKTFRDRTGKYGRYIANVYTDDHGELCVNEWMVANGYAEPYQA